MPEFDLNRMREYAAQRHGRDVPVEYLEACLDRIEQLEKAEGELDPMYGNAMVIALEALRRNGGQITIDPYEVTSPSTIIQINHQQDANSGLLVFTLQERPYPSKS